jgi:hypothetical protein
VCLNCRNWQAAGTPGWAAAQGYVCCQVKRTKAVTLSYWAACGHWSPVAADEVEKRVRWLARRGVVVKTEIVNG